MIKTAISRKPKAWKGQAVHSKSKRKGGVVCADLYGWGLKSWGFCSNNHYYMSDQLPMLPMPFLYFDPSPEHSPLAFCSLTDKLAEILQMVQQQKELNAQVMREVVRYQKANKELKQKNRELREEAESEYELERRNYSTRRMGLQKKYACQQENCEKRYSSQIALRNHERDFHGLRRVVRDSTCTHHSD